MEPHGQCEVFAGGPQRAIAAPGAALWLAGIRGSRDESIEESAAEGRRSCRHGGAGKELTPIERGPFRNACGNLRLAGGLYTGAKWR